LNITRTAFERVYRTEKDARIKEILLLVLNVVYHNKVAAHVVREIHKSKDWASQWLKRYREEGISGLKDRSKCGRHPKVSRQIEYKIKTILKESNQQGWSTKQVEEKIIHESGVRYHRNYIYHVLHKWGFKQNVSRKVHINTASAEEKEEFKKRSARYLWISNTK
jgi:transposase